MARGVGMRRPWRVAKPGRGCHLECAHPSPSWPSFQQRSDSLKQRKQIKKAHGLKSAGPVRASLSMRAA
eukprot:10136585-Lingulodinium_polyedra.AAC.1